MSDEQRITKVELEKDPRRVAAGKKLAAISRAAKERKAAERSVAERSCDAEDKEPTDNTENSETSYMTVIAGVGVLTGLVCLYFTYKQDKRASEVLKRPEPDGLRQSRSNSDRSDVGNRLRSLD